MKQTIVVGVLLMVVTVLAAAQLPPTQDVLGVHDMGSGVSPVRGSASNACMYCHAPHSGQSQGPLWGQTFSHQTYTFYSNESAQNRGVQPALGSASTLCLSCHDGTVAIGLSVPYGQMPMSGSLTSTLGTELDNSHPFSLVLPLQDAASLVSSLAATGSTADPLKAVKLANGNVECTSCHNVHVQNVDKLSPNFLVRENRKGALCLSCHDSIPRTVNGINNPLVPWLSSVHSTSGAELRPNAGMGGYATIAETACLACHRPHNAAGRKALLRGSPTPAPAIDSTSQSCMSCHNGGDKLLVPLPDVFAEYQSAEKKSHPFANPDNAHTTTEPVVLDQNRHAACVDCHNAHGANKVTGFNLPPEIRASQSAVPGVAADGTKLAGAATMQYENCLRCHGNSSGKQSLPGTYGYLPSRAIFAGDPLNVIPQFANTAASAHPVMRDSTKLAQPSLLGSMWDLLGKTPMRTIGLRIYCTDCHNNDNNREFGGTGPNGPHASRNFHILERPYLASQVNAGTWPTGGPGTAINNLFYPLPSLDPGGGGPYSLCAKCHDLNNVMSNASFSEHSKHIGGGVSCSVCHSAHGVPAGSSASSLGKGLINFDTNVVAPNAGVISYTTTKTCALVCHMVKHNADGTRTGLSATSPSPF